MMPMATEHIQAEPAVGLEFGFSEPAGGSLPESPGPLHWYRIFQGFCIRWFFQIGTGKPSTDIKNRSARDRAAGREKVERTGPRGRRHALKAIGLKRHQYHLNYGRT
jgi:hypothetical protein